MTLGKPSEIIAVTTSFLLSVIWAEILTINFSLIPQIWKIFAFKKAAVKVQN
jgi:hypothetical protein